MSRTESLIDWIFTLIGGISITICICSMFPQTIRMYRTKKTKSVSKLSLYINGMGMSMAIAYSFYFKLWEIFCPEVLGFIIIVIQLCLKKCYDHRDDLDLLHEYQDYETYETRQQQIQPVNSSSPISITPDSERMDLDSPNQFKAY